MSLQIDYQLTLTFQGPLLTQSSGTIALGLDVEMQYYQDLPAINGSLIRGNIRHTLNEFDQILEGELTKDINTWFGSESISQYKPQRTKIDFDFFWLLTTNYKKTQNQRTRIAINQRTGTVEEGALQIVEDCFPIGSDNPVFSGKINARFIDRKEQKQFEKWLNKALDYIPAMGSFKGIGWGKLIEAKLNSQKTEHPTLPENATRFGIQLQFDRPFCLGRPRTTESNQIISDDFIAGNVIKGLIARLYNDDKETLAKQLCFDQLIISHALATDKQSNKRAQPIPLSFAIYKGKVIDMAGAQKTVWKSAPQFSPDWKEEDKEKINAIMQQGIANLQRLVVVRTEINSANHVSEQGKLFSLECISPEQHLWCADIDLCNIAKEKQTSVLSNLQQKLSKGLTGIGKTKAQAKISFHLDKPYKAEVNALTLGRHIITLITAARILSPDLSIQGTNSASQLKKAYQNYWQHALDNQQLILDTYFAEQTLTGTYYHQQRHQTEKKYYPEWLTNAGSVFVLTINDEDTLARLIKLASTGIPAHQEVDGSKANWKTTPYLPEQGYGEIQINNPVQLNIINRQSEDAQ